MPERQASKMNPSDYERVKDDTKKCVLKSVEVNARRAPGTNGTRGSPQHLLSSRHHDLNRLIKCSDEAGNNVRESQASNGEVIVKFDSCNRTRQVHCANALDSTRNPCFPQPARVLPLSLAAESHVVIGIQKIQPCPNVFARFAK